MLTKTNFPIRFKSYKHAIKRIVLVMGCQELWWNNQSFFYASNEGLVSSLEK